MKMKRVLACALSAAMIVTFVSFGNMGVGMVHAAVDIENESVTVEEKVLKEIESEVLRQMQKQIRSRNRQLGIMMVKLGGHLMMRIIGGILDIREIL